MAKHDITADEVIAWSVHNATGCDLFREAMNFRMEEGVLDSQKMINDPNYMANWGAYYDRNSVHQDKVVEWRKADKKWNPHIYKGDKV